MWQGENYDNIYEGDAQFNKQQVTLRKELPVGQDPNVPTRNPTGNQEKSRSYKKIWRIIAIALGLTAVALLIAVIALTELRTNGNSTPNEESKDLSDTKATGQVGTGEDILTSCDEIRKRKTMKSGIYVVKPNENSFQTEVYCDMETDGGGWTLVASIHESDIRRKCFYDDLWSAYVPEHQMTEIAGKTNWNNEMTFGTVQKCFEDDFKSSAYYSLNASDLMVWHVHLGFHVDHMRTRSTFRYRTDGKFLQKYGGNLKNLFGKHFPLNIKTDEASSKVLDALIGKSDELKSQVPDWYDYPTGTGNQISDSTMYNSQGSMMYFRSNTRSYERLNYGQKYRFYASASVASSSVSSRPLIVIGDIWNDNGANTYYEIEVKSYSTRVTGYTTVPEMEGRVTLGNFALQYKAVQLYDPAKNTPCEFFFVVTNTEIWTSAAPTSFQRSYTHYYYNNRYTRYRIDGSPRKLIFGYILLARQIGKNFTTEHLVNVSNVILQTISETKDIFRASSTYNTLTVPIIFDKGSVDEMMSTIPPDYRPSVEAGYLQFRAYNQTGYPSALCPGIRVNSSLPEHVCIGGVSGDIEPYGSCGDFAGWGGTAADTILSSQPSGAAHSHKEILSTILLFYR